MTLHVAELKALNDSAKRHPERRKQSLPKSNHPLGEPPPEFREDELRCWAELQWMLPPIWLTRTDRWVAESACKLMAKLRRNEANAADIGRLLTCIGTMGMTPADRGRIVSTAPETASTFGEFASYAVSVELALNYARDVLAKTIPACLLVQHACRRFLDDIAAADAGTSAWEFRRDLAERVMRWCGLLQNVKGPLAGKPLQLMPWQALVVASLYGFVERGTDTRRFRQGVIFVPRGNGKTTFAAPLMLYSAFAEKEAGAEAYAAATTRDQAKLLWDTARQMCKASPDMTKAMGISIGAHSVYQTRTASKCVAVSSDAKSLEGLSVHFACCDEIASHINSNVYDVMLTAMGKRKHPLMLSISTATGNNYGVGRTLWDYATRVLQGEVADDRMFCLIYTIDDGDDPWQESTWIKANPSWGVSVQPDAIRAIMSQARNNPAQESAAMTRHCNVWQGADEALFSTRAWKACADPTLDLASFGGQEAEIAIDLASRIDLASVAIVFPRREGDAVSYTAFSRNYINEAAVLEGRNASYPAWAKAGHLRLTSGNETDFSVIEADIIELCKQFRVRSLGFDPWQAAQLSQRLAAEGIAVIEMRQNVGVMSEPTKELQAAMMSGRIKHTGDPVLEWCISNVVGHYDVNSNVKPNKAPHRDEAKVDAAISLIMAIGRCMANEQMNSIYETRDLTFV